MVITDKPLLVNYESLGELEKAVGTITYGISVPVFPNFHSRFHNSLVKLNSIKFFYFLNAYLIFLYNAIHCL